MSIISMKIWSILLMSLMSRLSTFFKGHMHNHGYGPASWNPQTKLEVYGSENHRTKRKTSSHWAMVDYRIYDKSAYIQFTFCQSLGNTPDPQPKQMTTCVRKICCQFFENHPHPPSNLTPLLHLQTCTGVGATEGYWDWETYTNHYCSCSIGWSNLGKESGCIQKIAENDIA